MFCILIHCAHYLLIDMPYVLSQAGMHCTVRSYVALCEAVVVKYIYRVCKHLESERSQAHVSRASTSRLYHEPRKVMPFREGARSLVYELPTSTKTKEKSKEQPRVGKRRSTLYTEGGTVSTDGERCTERTH